MHWLWVTGGLMALGLGMIGIFLPLVPTVPFLILAAFCLHARPNGCTAGFCRTR